MRQVVSAVPTYLLPHFPVDSTWIAGRHSFYTVSSAGSIGLVLPALSTFTCLPAPAATTPCWPTAPSWRRGTRGACAPRRRPRRPRWQPWTPSSSRRVAHASLACCASWAVARSFPAGSLCALELSWRAPVPAHLCLPIPDLIIHCHEHSLGVVAVMAPYKALALALGRSGATIVPLPLRCLRSTPPACPAAHRCPPAAEADPRDGALPGAAGQQGGDELQVSVYRPGGGQSRGHCGCVWGGVVGCVCAWGGVGVGVGVGGAAGCTLARGSVRKSPPACGPALVWVVQAWHARAPPPLTRSKRQRAVHGQSHALLLPEEVEALQAGAAGGATARGAQAGS